MSARALSVLAIIGAAALVAPATFAQAADHLGAFESPFGVAPGGESQPFDAGSRDGFGNRLIVDGRIQTGAESSAFSSGVGGSFASATGISSGTAIGNQLNVITNGSWNTVIINATQTNTGNQTAALNGGVSLND